MSRSFLSSALQQQQVKFRKPLKILIKRNQAVATGNGKGRQIGIRPKTVRKERIGRKSRKNGFMENSGLLRVCILAFKDFEKLGVGSRRHRRATETAKYR